MNHKDQQMLGLGREVFRMIEDSLLHQSSGSVGYALRKMTCPDGRGGKHRFTVIVAIGDELVAKFDEVAEKHFTVQDVTAPSPDAPPQ